MYTYIKLNTKDKLEHKVGTKICVTLLYFFKNISISFKSYFIVFTIAAVELPLFMCLRPWVSTVEDKIKSYITQTLNITTGS